MLVSSEWDQPPAIKLRNAWNVKAMDRVKEKQRAHALIEIVALTAKGIERLEFCEPLRQGRTGAGRIERLIPNGRLRRGDDLGQHAAHLVPPNASNSTIPVKTSSRS